jgi:hypothetical protein
MAAGGIADQRAGATTGSPVIRRLFFLQKNPKIFGIGLSRTGTRTLHEAMLRLGYRSRHYAFDQQIVDYLRKRRRPSELRLHALEEFDSLHDVPICALYQPLDRAYPGSKLILTVRDKES